MKTKHFVTLCGVILLGVSTVGAQAAPVTEKTTCDALLPGINNVYNANANSRTGVEYLDRTGKLISSMSRSESRSTSVRDGGARSAGTPFRGSMLAAIRSNEPGKAFRGIVKKVESKDPRNSEVQTFACAFKRSPGGSSWSVDQSEYGNISSSASKGSIATMADSGDTSRMGDWVYVVGAHGSINGTGIDTRVDLFLTVSN